MGHPQGHEYGAAVCLPSPFFLTESAQSVNSGKKAEGEEERNSTEEIAEQNDGGGDQDNEDSDTHDDDVG